MPATRRRSRRALHPSSPPLHPQKGKSPRSLAQRYVSAPYEGKPVPARVVETTTDPAMFLVHYVGWNPRYDQWVTEESCQELPEEEQARLRGEEMQGEGEEEDGAGKARPEPEPAQRKKKRARRDGKKKKATKATRAAKEEEEEEEKGVVEHERDEQGEGQGQAQVSVVNAKKEEEVVVEVEGEQPQSKEPAAVSSYEQQRLENIRRNQEMLAMLNLKGIADSARRKAVRKNKVVRSKKPPKRRDSAPSRRSLRVQNLDPEGHKLPDNFRPLPQNAYRPREREEGTLELSKSNKDFLKDLVVAGGEDGRPAAKLDVSTLDYAKGLAALQIPEGFVTKVCPQRIYSAAVHPGDRLMIAAGDKYGNVGLWRVGAADEDDGVAQFHPHGNVVAGLMFDKKDPNKMNCSSYDGRIRTLDLQKQCFSELLCEDDDSFYGMDAKKGSSVVYVSTLSGSVIRTDPREKKSKQEWSLHENKIFTVSINPGDTNYFCTASLDRTVRIWDERNIKKKPIHQMIHGLCVSGASFSPNGRHIVSCCNDCRLRVWRTEDLKKGTQIDNGPEPASSLKHDTRTGRWLTKFKCEWDPKQSNAFVVGSMDQPRCVEVYGVNEGSKISRIMRLRDDYVGSVQSVNLFHPTLNALLSANSSGRCHVWTSAEVKEA